MHPASFVLPRLAGLALLLRDLPVVLMFSGFRHGYDDIVATLPALNVTARVTPCVAFCYDLDPQNRPCLPSLLRRDDSGTPQGTPLPVHRSTGSPVHRPGHSSIRPPRCPTLRPHLSCSAAR